MKKILLLLVLFLFPFVVFAKDMCDSSDIEIKSIVLEDTIGNIEEVSDASISNQKINLGLKMNVLGDAAEYKIVIKNNSLEDYYFDEESFNLDSLNYEVHYDDGTNLIKGGEEKIIYLKVSYNEKVDTSLLENGLYNGTQAMKLNITTLENPYTGRFLGLLVFISLMIGFFVLYKDKKRTAYLLLLISFIIPFSVRAVCRHSLEVDTNLVIDAREAIFLPGEQLNIKMKELAGNDLSTTESPLWFFDTNIIAFKYSSNQPSVDNMSDEHIVSTEESGYPIYMWFDNGTIYWWSEDKTPSLNETSTYVFCGLKAMEDASGVVNFDLTSSLRINFIFEYCESIPNLKMVQNWNVSNVINMFSAFEYTISVTSLEGLEKWDLRSCKRIARLFQLMTSLSDISALENWDISNVEGMWYIFQGDSNITSFEPIRNWDTSSMLDMSASFTKTSIDSLEVLRNWDVSNVVNMYALFADCINLTSLSGIEDWDTSKVQNMSWMFGLQTATYNEGKTLSLTSLKEIENWDTSSVKNMSYMFYLSTNLVSLDLSHWDVSNVQSIESMFYKCRGLAELNVKNWNTSSLTNMFEAFAACSSLVHLDLSGWDTSNVTNMCDLFDSCSSLESLDLSNWDTSNVTDMSYMFNSLSSMRELDLSSFNTKSVTTFKRMFNGSNALEKIYVGENWDTSANTGETKYVFSTVSNLPNYSNTNPNYRDLSYAHTGEGGYLTLKTS